MVYMMSSTRAGRPTKEKAKANHNSKSDGPSMNQKPTAEQMRLASSMKTSDDPEMEQKILQVAELTGRSKDEACFALHDCDYDLERAVEKLFENESQTEWQEMKTKKKKNQQTSKSEIESSIPDESLSEIPERNHNFEKDYNNDRSYERSGSAPRGRRNDRAPPRFQKAGRGRPLDEERDRGDSQSRDRGRGRGRGSSRGRGRGRGAGGVGGNGPRKPEFGSTNSRERGSNFDNGPGMSIDTWSNDVAEEPKKENSFGTWGEMTTEDWTGDEWQGSLDKTTVFTSSVNNEASKVFSDNDAKMFSVTSIETQAFNNTLSNSMPSPPQLDSYQHTAPSIPDPIQQLTQPKPIGQNSVSQGAIGQPPVMPQASAIGQGSGSMSQNSLGQRLDLGLLLSGKSSEFKQPDSVEAVTQQTAELTKETADFMAQFQKQATETIKNVVGIGSSSSQNTASLSATQPPPSSQTQPPPSAQQQSLSADAVPATTAPPSSIQQPTQTKAQRPLRSTTKLPPPSKIPASAVVMPGAGNKFGSSVDVEFGCFSESPGGFKFGSISGVSVATTESNTYSSSGVNASLGNHLSQVNKSEPQAQSVMTSSTSSVTSQQQPSVSSILESMTQQNSQSPRPSVAYTPTTPPKNYSQTTKISSPPDPIPFPDRKSPYQPTGSSHTQSDQAPSVQLSSYSQSGYSSSAYPSSAYKSVPAISSTPSGVGSGFSSSHGSSSLSSGSGSLSSSNPLQNYQSSSFQSQQQQQNLPGSTVVGGSSGYTGGASSATGSSSLYPTGSGISSSSSFQTGQSSVSYSSSGNQSSVVGGVYQSGGGTSYLTRDSQSAPAFQSSVSASATGGQPPSAYQQTTNSSSSSSASASSNNPQSSSSAYQRETAVNSSVGVSNVGVGQTTGGYGVPSQSPYSSVVSAAQQQHQAPSASSLSSNKSLNESLSKLTVKESATSLEEQLSQAGVTGHYDASSVAAAVVGGGSAVTNLHTSAMSTPNSISTGSVTMSSVGSLGITNNGGLSSTTNTAMSSSNTATSVSISKSALPVTTKAPVNLPPGMPPLIGHGQTNYMIGQPGFPIAFGLQQHPMYSYEDLMHQRMPLHTATTLTGLDQTKLAAAAAAAAANYTAADASKINRVEAQSPVNAQQSSQQTQQQQPQSQTTPQQQPQQQSASQQQQQTQQSATHGQAFPMAPNPAAGLPGYYNYYMGGLPQTAYPYQTQLIPLNNLMPTVTNTGVTSANAQFQKTAYNYGSAASYDSLSGASHDFSKAFGVGVTQSQNKVSAASMSVSSSSDLSSYQKQTGFEKSGFAGGTPPPFSTLPPGLPTGTQTGQGQLGGGTPFMQAQYMPQALAAAAAAHPSQMLHQLHQAQDTSGGSGRGGQQSSSQPKSLMGTKPNNYSGAYWGGN